tara:strand:- start:136 stop:405 length:270 start_codon:yes stop_codon:yes gene_type:complete
LSWPARGSLETPLAGSISKEIEMKRPDYIVIQGNPIEGYTFTGPMPQEGALLLASHLVDWKDDTYIAPLQEPQAIPVPVSELDPEELPF